MAGIAEFASTGEYRDERLYLLEAVRRLEKKQDEVLEQLGATKDRLIKIATDLNEAHGRIRTLIHSKDELERRLLRMELRAGAIATLAGLLAAGAIAALKAFVFYK